MDRYDLLYPEYCKVIDTCNSSTEELSFISGELFRVISENDTMHEDNFRICNTKEECDALHECCSNTVWEFALPSGRIVWLGYDDGH